MYTRYCVRCRQEIQPSRLRRKAITCSQECAKADRKERREWQRSFKAVKPRLANRTGQGNGEIRRGSQNTCPASSVDEQPSTPAVILVPVASAQCANYIPCTEDNDETV